VPLFLLCGDADDVVPYEENGAIVQERYQRLGGPVQTLIKKGMGHHPHGLDDPTPVVEFILKHTVASSWGDSDGRAQESGGTAWNWEDLK
jgi:alpha-beta hydrolase superfamily lysophospholipase